MAKNEPTTNAEDMKYEIRTIPNPRHQARLSATTEGEEKPEATPSITHTRKKSER